MIALSEVLNRLPLHPRGEREQFFRNPNGVAMKLGNFLRFDPDYDGAGIQRGNRLEEKVWNTFASEREKLAHVAASIKESADGSPAYQPPADEPEYEAKEGRLLTRVHRSRERDSSLVRKKKRDVLEADPGRLSGICIMRVVDLFAGLGGMTCGALEAGASVVLAVDSDPTPLKVLGANAPATTTVVATLGEGRDEVSLPPAAPDLHVHLSTPCTELSVARRCTNADTAGGLEMIRCTAELSRHTRDRARRRK